LPFPRRFRRPDIVGGSMRLTGLAVVVVVLAAACGYEENEASSGAAGAMGQKQPMSAARPAPTRTLTFPADAAVPPLLPSSQQPSAGAPSSKPAQPPAAPARPAIPASPLPTSPQSPSTGCSELELRADDDTFLGVATSNQFATDSVCNEFSTYGSEFAIDGIFNEFSQYGSEFSHLSAYNQYTQTPPHLYCGRSEMNPVTKNKYLPLAIDPDILCEVVVELGY